MKNNYFWIKVLDVVLIIGALLFYNQYAGYHKSMQAANSKVKAYADQVKQIRKSSSAKSGSASGSAKYKDGTYTGSARGYGGTITVKVTVEQDTITDINVTDASHETAEYYNSAVKVLDNILNSQTTDVATVSGATYSSTGLKNAVKSALSKAKK